MARNVFHRMKESAATAAVLAAACLVARGGAVVPPETTNQANAARPEKSAAKAERIRLQMLDKGSPAYRKAVLERIFGNTPPARRHMQPQYILSAADVAEQMADRKAADEWGREMFGEDTQAARIFALFREMLQGRYDHLLSLCGIVPNANWDNRAEWLKAIRRKHDPAGENSDAIAALHLLEMCAGSSITVAARSSFRVVEEAPEALQAEFIRVLREADHKEEYDTVLAHLRTTLRYAMRYKPLPEPWARLLLDLTHDAAEFSSVLAGLRVSKDAELAAEFGRRAVAEHPDNVRLIDAAFEALARAGRGKEAFELMLDAERRLPYPERRDMRMAYFYWLRATAYKYRKTPMPEGLMSFAEEEEARRYDASWLDDLEAQMALGDIEATARDSEEAAFVYHDVWARATDPALKWAAWLAWAETDADAAWPARDYVAGLLSDGADVEPGNGYSFLACGLAAGVAAGRTEEALAWVEKHADTGGTNATPVLAHIVATLQWLRGDTNGVTALLDAAEDDSLTVTTVGSLMAIADRSPFQSAGIPATLARATSIPLSRQFSRTDVWTRAMELAIARLPTCTSASTPGALWQRLVARVPKKADREAAELQEKLTAACLACAERRAAEKDTAAVRNLLQAGAYHCYNSESRSSLANGQALFMGAVELAARFELPAAYLRTPVNYILKGFKRNDTPEPEVAALKAAIAEHYPALVPTPEKGTSGEQ